MLVVVQQMYYRYYNGQTKDERFKEIVQLVFTLDELARKIIAQSNLLKEETTNWPVKLSQNPIFN